MSATVEGDPSSTLVRAYRTTAIVYFLLVFFGLVRGDSPEQILAYLLVLSAAVLPSVLWLRLGAPGIPVFPAVGLAYIPYFAWPVLRDNENTQAYTLTEIALAGVTVALFLVAATFAWRLIAGVARPVRAGGSDQGDPTRVVGFLLTGLGVGCVYHILDVPGWLDGLGSWFGLVRSVALTFVTVACFLLGVTLARGSLRGKALAAAMAGLAAITVMAWSSLFLVGGLIYLLAAMTGYVLVAKRIPFLIVGAVFVAVTILHAGKAEMRDKYWIADMNAGEAVSVTQLPELMVEWIVDGLYGIASGDVGTSVIDRASLIQMILLVRAATPDQVDFLRGETYALLPSILVPRFINSNKPASQVGMDLLNIRYGVLTVEGAATTAVGWGIIAEAYANFGYSGVIGIALLLGAFCGVLGLWSAHADIMSIPTLASIATMMRLINIESDFIQLFSTLLQSFAAVLVFSVLYRWFAVPPASPLRAGQRTLRDNSVV